MTHPRVYRLLVSSGHSAQKAAEIILDARRGDLMARRWIRFLFRQKRSGRERL